MARVRAGAPAAPPSVRWHGPPGRTVPNIQAAGSPAALVARLRRVARTPAAALRDVAFRFGLHALLAWRAAGLRASA